MAARDGLHYTKKAMANRIPVFPHEGIGKTFYKALLLLAALAGTVITSYRLPFGARDFDALYWLITAVYLLDIACSFNQAVKKGLVGLAARKRNARHSLAG